VVFWAGFAAIQRWQQTSGQVWRGRPITGWPSGAPHTAHVSGLVVCRSRVSAAGGTPRNSSAAGVELRRLATTGWRVELITLAPYAVAISVESMRVGAQDTEAAVGNVAAIEIGIGWRRRDADIRIGWSAAGSSSKILLQGRLPGRFWFGSRHSHS
jgi:hypothetical protein